MKVLLTARTSIESSLQHRTRRLSKRTAETASYLRSLTSGPMPCLLALLMVAFPRIAIVLLFFFTNYFVRPFHNILFLLLGFIFLPLTTIVYAWVVNAGEPVAGIYLVAIIIAVLADIGLLSGGEYHRRRW